MMSSDTTRENPEFLVLPTMAGAPQVPDDTSSARDHVEVALLPVTGDNGEAQLTALAFTSVPLLVEAMGERQPWVIIPTGELERCLVGSGARSVLIDPRPADGGE
ncbi:SAV_915 family protein [Streptomyces lancefieldiae]|uniref:SAV_915 family protein n=1 Tax=Streptomyces lancefieldiae TaxID=3075520 RepID=A0ABU3ATS4_9ACTN|nr:SAV_915 family protein [Streptomyces sp. DSM 40712]MDT0613566.1 SAV_915 family protein [Streptomyces sp. DSM 40712]